jgi:AcrR family transcriptional regulator
MARAGRSEGTRNEILRSAGEEFARYSLESARLERIMSRINLTTGAFYFHFESKDALARTLVDTNFGSSRRLVGHLRANGARVESRIVV